MRTSASVKIIILLSLTLTLPAYAARKPQRVAGVAKTLLVWLQGKVSPPWPAPAPAPAPASSETDRTKS